MSASFSRPDSNPVTKLREDSRGWFSRPRICAAAHAKPFLRSLSRAEHGEFEAHMINMPHYRQGHGVGPTLHQSYAFDDLFSPP